MNNSHYSTLSKIFSYPESGYFQEVAKIRNYLEIVYPESTVNYSKFFSQLSTEDYLNEEYYLNTFEIEGICCMDIGYILFGEDYKRGDFLAKIQHEQHLCKNDTGIELADHLTNILNLMSRHEDPEFVEELGNGLLIPAIIKILEKFNGTKNHYQYAFELLLEILEKDFENLKSERYTIETNNCAGSEYSCYSECQPSASKK